MTGRKGKQLCLITVHGDPCGGCVARRTHCTFELPPLRRHSKTVGNILAESASDIRLNETSHDRLPVSEDLVGNASSSFESFPVATSWGSDLPQYNMPQTDAGSLRQRSDTILSEGFPLWSGMQNTSTVCEYGSTASSPYITNLPGYGIR